MLKQKYKILNLYACLGGNRAKWDEVADNLEITAVELDDELARMYQERFPNDKVIVADAHQYLLEHYKEYDFIWSSPPCPTHSTIRMTQKTKSGFIPKYPDMMLYQEIIFIDNHFKGKYVIENVIPYYEPLIPAKKRGRHLYWTNFNLPSDLNGRKLGENLTYANQQNLEKWHKIDLTKYKGSQRKDKIARNLVDFEVGKTILETVLGIEKQNNSNQITMF